MKQPNETYIADTPLTETQSAEILRVALLQLLILKPRCRWCRLIRAFKTLMKNFRKKPKPATNNTPVDRWREL